MIGAYKNSWISDLGQKGLPTTIDFSPPVRSHEELRLDLKL
jgi:hypothetical protein